MNSIQLKSEDGKTSIWACGICGKVSQDQHWAEKCCLCSYCGKQVDSKEHNGIYHGACWTANHEKMRAERLERAERVTVWDGPVFVESGIVSNDGFFASLDDLLEYLANEPVESRPGFVWLSKVIPFGHIYTSDIIENKMSDMDEDAPDRLAGEDELQAALDAFCEKNKDVISYEPDYNRVIVVPSAVEMKP